MVYRGDASCSARPEFGWVIGCGVKLAAASACFRRGGSGFKLHARDRRKHGTRREAPPVHFEGNMKKNHTVWVSLGCIALGTALSLLFLWVNPLGRQPKREVSFE